jgi:hypothetical protein
MDLLRLGPGLIRDDRRRIGGVEGRPRRLRRQTPDGLYASKLSAGLAITSTATPSLNGTYAINPEWQGRIEAISDGLANGKGLPHNAATIAWKDINGGVHNFSPKDFLNFSVVVRDYVFDMLGTESALAQGLTATWPTATAAIA